jgi:5-methylcytosine-specific restriction endonuclease McrA
MDAFRAAWEWKRLSYEARQKADWKCQAWGCHADGKKGAKIVCDHIRPIRSAEGWARRLDPNNLQVLCNDCNMGKGSWDQTDFRTPNMRLRLSDSLRKSVSSHIEFFTRAITFRRREKVPEEDG